LNLKNFAKTVTITNVAPTQTVGSTVSVAASTPTDTQIRFITAVNGSAKTSANANGLTFSIQSGNTDNDFTIDSSTGSIKIANALTSGDSYTLAIRTTDVGGLQDNDNLVVNVTASNFTSFYLSEGDSSATDACNRAVGTLRYHNGTDTTPSEGNTVYTDAQGTTVLNGGGQTFAWAPGGGAHNGSGTSFFATISASGIVGSVTLCS
jgi:hypothetical protein